MNVQTNSRRIGVLGQQLHGRASLIIGWSRPIAPHVVRNLGYRLLQDDLNSNEPWKSDTIRLHHPGIAAWSLDHHVFTAGLVRGGRVHTDFAHIMDRFFGLLYPSEELLAMYARYQPALQAVMLVVPAMFNSTLVNERIAVLGLWQEVLSWALDSISQKLQSICSIDVQYR